MKLWVIKRKGKFTLGNMLLANEIEFSDGKKIYCDKVFYRKKDAKQYLKAYEALNECCEVVSFNLTNQKEQA